MLSFRLLPILLIDASLTIMASNHNNIPFNDKLEGAKAWYFGEYGYFSYNSLEANTKGPK